jgi:serine/threonine-protein kinase
MSIYQELKRRNVFRVGAAYIVTAWLLIQVVETIFPLFGFGDTPARIVVIVLAIGFPLFLLFSWVFELTPEGLKKEKDIDRAVSVISKAGKRLDRIIIVFLALGLGYFAFDNSIAVLPFVNMSDDLSNEYFSDGMSEEILNLLAKIPELRVISRSSAFSFKGTGTQIPEIAKRLNVAHILEGSVRKSGDQVRITAQLIEARTDTHLWSETYDRNVLDMFAVQDEIAGAITTQLELTIIGSRQSDRPTANEEAYDHYLRGISFHHQYRFQKALDHFRAAIDLDPDYAQAHAWLSLELTSLGNMHVLHPLEVFPRAKEAAMTALELDEDLHLAHVALGWVAMSYERDWSKAEYEFRRAIELAPGAYEGYQGLVWPLQVTGRYDEAIASALKAHDADPLLRWSRGTLQDLYYKVRDYEAALELMPYLLETAPSGSEGEAMAWLSNLYAARQEPIKALENAEKAASLTGGDPVLELYVALTYAMLGDHAEARKILQNIDPDNESRYISPGYFAMVYANLGEYDLAMENLARSVEEYDSWIWNLDYPMWDAIRSDQRFTRLCNDLVMACANQPMAEKKQ